MYIRTGDTIIQTKILHHQFHHTLNRHFQVTVIYLVILNTLIAVFNNKK